MPRTPIYHGRLVDLGIEPVRLPGARPFTLELVRHPGGAAVVALNEVGEVCLIRQYRHAGGGWIWELPAGKLEPGEPPEVTARRELEEEAGVRAGRWDALGSLLSTPGFCDERIHLYLARDLTPVPTAHEEHEHIEVHWRPLDDAVAQAMSGEIDDAKTIIGLLRAAACLKTP
ncbi:NUDIX domain-containing protein [Endothiovibrio diazotrophicus]